MSRVFKKGKRDTAVVIAPLANKKPVVNQIVRHFCEKDRGKSVTHIDAQTDTQSNKKELETFFLRESQSSRRSDKNGDDVQF